MNVPKLRFKNLGRVIKIEGDDFIPSEELLDKIIENIKRNCCLTECKNCGLAMIRNSPTHKICWRCKGNSGDVEL